ncbi:COX15/CtaA family protein [Niveispirillum fermenti]|uniref:COX15/CtaA family protein n=1 Tax=Niveispirillum fermenti TaxID=1233113 RepID=UPI003A857A1E
MSVAQTPSVPGHRAVANWLLFCAGMVFAMAIIGAITRLTESGLSITEWKPITGTIPPLNEAQWLAEFEKYKQIPEYQVLKRGMSLDEFKQIFFWEWFHRLWGRLIGVVFAVPLVWFAVKGMVTRQMLPRLVGLFLLGGLQGFIGWFMVQSGLSERTDVSHYRLALHLGMALFLYALLVQAGLDLRHPQARRHPERAGLVRLGRVSLALVAVTVIWGAFVAGLDAGLAYNSWPLMNDAFAPPEIWNLRPVWLNIFENTAMVQFIHRWLAILTAGVTVAYCWRIGQRTDVPAVAKRAALWLMLGIGGQVVLGITTLLHAVPVALGAAHQGGALIVITLLIRSLHTLRRHADDRHV